MAAPRLTVWAPAVVSKVSESAERTVTPLLQSSGLAAMPAVVKSVVALLLLSASTEAVAEGEKATMLPPETWARLTAPLAPLTEAHERMPLGPVPARLVVATIAPEFAEERSRSSAPAVPREIAPRARVVLVPPFASRTTRASEEAVVVSARDWLLTPEAAPR